MVHSPRMPSRHTLSHIKLWCAENTFCVTSCYLWVSEPALSYMHLLPIRWECLWRRWFRSAVDYWYPKWWVTHQADRIKDLPKYSRQYKPDREPGQAKTPELAEQLTLGTLTPVHHPRSDLLGFICSFLKNTDGCYYFVFSSEGKYGHLIRKKRVETREEFMLEEWTRT